MRKVKVAATQMACSWNIDNNLANAEKLIRSAATQGAQIILIQELFETPYFCIDQDSKHLELAKPFIDNALIKRFSVIAKELSVVLPLSYFERDNSTYFNSLCVIDADGSIMDNYRKTHIPNGPGYQEKQYFSPGDTGFKVWQTKYGKIGVGICWDQWFPETARSLALLGAELIFFPTAIGSEPQDASIDSKDHWQRTMQGHAAANMIPVIASNRIGVETGDNCELTFYGSSFIADNTGAKVKECDRSSESIIVQEFDLDVLQKVRGAWGLFRDRRPECYQSINKK